MHAVRGRLLTEMSVMATPYAVFGYSDGGEMCWRFTQAVAPTDAMQAEEEPGFDPVFALDAKAVGEILRELERLKRRGAE